MDILNNVATLILTYGLVGIKDVAPYIIKRYGSKKVDGTYNKEMLRDINKDLGITFIRFPSDLIIISASSFFAKIVSCSNEIITSDAETIGTLTVQLNTSHICFASIIFILLPLFVLFTRMCESWYYPRRKVKPHRIRSIIINVLLHLLSFLFVCYVLFVMKI